MQNVEENLSKVKKEIVKDFLDPFSSTELKDFLCSKSKLIRSKFSLLYLCANNINIDENIIKILAAGEIIHNASLLHDDVIDNAEYRRGKKTFAKTFNSKVSILAGDYLLSYAIEKLLSLENFKILNIMKNCIKNMAYSEIEQYFLRNKDTKFDKYIEICKGKTAFLFSAIIESCFVLNGFNSEKAKSFAEKFGIYFQLKNDINEISAQNDKENGVTTLYEILGIENSKVLLDNYVEEMLLLISEHPDNRYNSELKDLVKNV